MQKAFCPNHGEVAPLYQIVAPLGGATSTAALANTIFKGNPLAVMIGMGLGLWLGANASKHCPLCGAVLQIIDDLDEFAG